MVKSKSEKSKNTTFIVGGVVVIVIALFVYSWSQGITESSTELQKPNCRDVQVPYESQEEYVKTEYYTETVPYTDQECEYKDLVHSITDFTFVSSVCNKQEEVCHKSYPVIGCVDKTTYCVDRTITCSVKLDNYDDERGSWDIKFSFGKEGSSLNQATDETTTWLYPKTSEIVYGSGRITDKEEINTQYTCIYRVTRVAQKQVCRDVLKYKEVERSRDVTAYRPVTKYKTERQCD